MNENQVQARFLNFYNKLTVKSKRAFRNRILDACKIEYPSFYSWLTRTSIPRWHLDRVNNVIDEFEEFEEAPKVAEPSNL